MNEINKRVPKDGREFLCTRSQEATFKRESDVLFGVVKVSSEKALCFWTHGGDGGVTFVDREETWAFTRSQKRTDGLQKSVRLDIGVGQDKRDGTLRGGVNTRRPKIIQEVRQTITRHG